MSSDAANNLITALCRSPEGVARLVKDPETAFEDFDLPEAQKEALREQAPIGMVESGVHPLLAAHYMFAFNPEMLQIMSIAEFPFDEEE